MSLVFYDTETTGVDTHFDQILQFAAIRTDQNLNEIDRFEIRCRLLPHVVPAPGAMRVTGIKASQLTDPSFPSHYEMVRTIRAKLMSWSPSIFMGYNSLKFDEELIRQALYKTLHGPYLTNRDGNSRSDVMRAVQACSLFAPSALIFPVGDKGKLSFKLDRVAPANGFEHKHAHDAMGDVEATIFMCQLLMKNAPDIWSSFMRFSMKAAVVDYIADERLFCFTDFFMGKPYSCLFTTIGQNKKNTAEWYIYDLSISPETLQNLSDSELAKRLKGSPKLVRELRSNGVPVLFPAENAPDICKGKDCGYEELDRRATVLQSNEALRTRLISIYESLQESYPVSPHVEKQLYGNFFQASDEKLMVEFHQVDWEKRQAIIEKFIDPRLKVLGTRLIYIERPDLLDNSTLHEHHKNNARRLLAQSDEIEWLSLPQAIKDLEEMLISASATELEMLKEHHEFLNGWLKEVMQFVEM